ncbi:MAG TPA: hypothetical protein VEH62_09345 [Gemmatimonadales bacterium]|nr:hypothetical protein [Gemmatimonadales bacterium]
MSQDRTDLAAARSRRLSALLQATDPPMPPLAFPAERVALAVRRRAAWRWRAAAAVVLLAVAAFGVPPVRAWIVQAARALWSAARPPKPAAVASSTDGSGGGGAVTFSPAAGSFALQVARPQPAGTLTVETAERATASAAVIRGPGARGGAELVVLPYGLRILNDSGATASYLVRVPASLGRISVAVGGGAVRVLVPSGPGQQWILDLRAAP